LWVETENRGSLERPREGKGVTKKRQGHPHGKEKITKKEINIYLNRKMWARRNRNMEQKKEKRKGPGGKTKPPDGGKGDSLQDTSLPPLRDHCTLQGQNARKRGVLAGQVFSARGKGKRDSGGP